MRQRTTTPPASLRNSAGLASDLFTTGLKVATQTGTGTINALGF